MRTLRPSGPHGAVLVVYDGEFLGGAEVVSPRACATAPNGASPYRCDRDVHRRARAGAAASRERQRAVLLWAASWHPAGIEESGSAPALARTEPDPHADRVGALPGDDAEAATPGARGYEATPLNSVRELTVPFPENRGSEGGQASNVTALGTAAKGTTKPPEDWS